MRERPGGQFRSLFKITMIFQFPDFETFHLAVTSSQVPPEVSAAPAEVAFDASGRPSVRPSVAMMPRAMLNAFKKLGVRQAKDHYAEHTMTVDCWPQVLPVVKAGRSGGHVLHTRAL